jgi:SAM-dependent methyltransferase
VLDLGGNRINKRGNFDIAQYPLRVWYANLVTSKQPHIQCRAESVPLAADSVDAVICAELLEHVPDPRAVLGEVARVLRPGGVLLISVPFLFRIHGDPFDYGRYTDHYWREVLDGAGFAEITIEKQGLFWSVLVDMLRDLVHDRAKAGRPRPAWLGRLLAHGIERGRRWAIARDAHPKTVASPFHSSYTTGFGIRCVRR